MREKVSTPKFASPRDLEDQDEDEYEYESRAGMEAMGREGRRASVRDDDDDEGP